MKLKEIIDGLNEIATKYPECLDSDVCVRQMMFNKELGYSPEVESIIVEQKESGEKRIVIH